MTFARLLFLRKALDKITFLSIKIRRIYFETRLDFWSQRQYKYV